MKKEICVALAGTGGYGELYVRHLLKDVPGRRFVGAVEPFPERSKLMPELKAKGIPIYPDLESLYKAATPDLMALCSPIHLHRPQAEFALAHGSNALCEKPAAGSLRDALAMLEAEKAHPDKFLAIGYQWSYSDALARIKADMASGVLGRPLRMRSLILWPRPLSYYKRNSWAGAIKTASGIEINDSPLNNATAHYLHNCLYLLGSAPTTLQAECYRANKIENYDGVALRCEREGVEILFYSSHATRVNLGPVCVYEFERGTISLESFRKDFVVRFHDGSVKSYGDPEEEMMKKLDDCVEAARSGTKPVCRIGDALPHIRCVEAAKRSMPPVGIPASEIEVLENGGDPLTTVKGLPELFTLAFASGRLPSELGVAKWAKSGERSLLEK